MFQHTAAQRRLGKILDNAVAFILFQHTAAQRRLAIALCIIDIIIDVSTHSRPKAAGVQSSIRRTNHPCFNTQPPKGGWNSRRYPLRAKHRFNTQPPKGGWLLLEQQAAVSVVSTHSRPKAAGSNTWNAAKAAHGFNTQPPKGGWFFLH